MDEVKKHLIQFVLGSIIASVFAGVFVFQITSDITYSISDTFYEEIGNLNNVQIENYVLKQYKNKEFGSINDLFKIFRSEFTLQEKYQVAEVLVSSVCIEKCISIKKILSSWSFYVLILIVVLYGLVLLKYYKNADCVEKFKDETFCDAYINSQGLHVLMEKFKNEAKSKSLTELRDALKSIREDSK